MKDSHAYKLGYQAISDVSDEQLTVKIPENIIKVYFIGGLKEACLDFGFDFDKLKVEAA